MGVTLLLDTHALVWWWQDDARLPSAARDAIGHIENEVVVSSVAAWEIANKYRLGKWPDVRTIVTGFETLVAREGFALMGVEVRHSLLAGSLPGFHRDPFDRLLAGQALTEAMTLVSADPQFGAFGVRTLWGQPVS